MMPLTWLTHPPTNRLLANGRPALCLQRNVAEYVFLTLFTVYRKSGSTSEA